MSPRILEIKQGVLDKNDRLAADLRGRFREAGTYVVNLMSGPGSGKTMLLEQTLSLLRDRGYTTAALVGDLETDNDARRLARSGVPVRQIRTAGNCHLEAEMIATHLAGWELSGLDYLFIENVGNLVCPASYDLGEQLRVVLISVTEGEDKPLKYPTAFNSADVAVITKIDLAEAVDFSREDLCSNVRDVHPDLPILETSAKRGQGMADWVAFLEAKRVSTGVGRSGAARVPAGATWDGCP